MYIYIYILYIYIYIVYIYNALFKCSVCSVVTGSQKYFVILVINCSSYDG